jgi:periplasmic protein CpxP/Spy
MPITSEEREQVVSELKRFARDLNLTDQQRERLQTALVEAREKIAEIRQRISSFLSPDQLTKWNAEVAKAKEFLGQRLES